MRKNVFRAIFLFFFGVLQVTSLHADELSDQIPIRDTFVDSSNLYEEYGAWSWLQISETRAVLVQWDLQSIPTDAIVTGAVLTFQKDTSAGSSVMDVWLRKRRAAWSEASANWANTTPDADPIYGSEIIDYFNTYQFIIDGPLLDIVGEWVADPSSNYGLALTYLDQGPLFTFYSKEDASGGNPPRLTVTYTPSASYPDLVVTSPGVSDSTPNAGQNFTVNARVLNQGDGTSASTTLRYYRSTNSTISTSDTQMATDSVGSIEPYGESLESAIVSISSAGTYWVGACVDAVSGESNTSNQCSSGVQVVVSASPTYPDLVVTSPGVSDSTPNAGQNFTVNARVLNQGDGTSASTTLRYYRSTNSTITTSDTQMATDSVGSIEPYGESLESAIVSISSAGTYWVGACVDAVSGESNTSNQCSSGVQVVVSASPTYPDLVVISPWVSDSTPNVGQNFTVNATVYNQGDGSSASTTLRYYLSSNSTITTSDTQIATDSVGILGTGETSAESAVVSISTAGTYWVGACVDAVSGESNTSNQCSSGVQVVVSASPTYPDLVVISPWVSDSTPNVGQNFTVNATVYNQGDGSSASTTLRYYLSSNSTITTSDTQIATDSVGILGTGETSAESAVVSISTEGTYWMGACVDAVSGESNTSNQCSWGVEILVSDASNPIFSDGFESGNPSAWSSVVVEPPPVDIIDDGSFEAGTPNPIWSESSTTYGTPLCSTTTCTPIPRTGDWWAWFGGPYQVVEVGVLQQEVTIPLAGNATLSFFLWITSSGGNGTDYLAIRVDGTEIFRVLESSPAYDSGYTTVQLDVSSYADGGSHSVTFESTTYGNGYSGFAVDDVSLTAAK